MHHLIGAAVVGAVASGAARNRIGIRSGLKRLVKGGIVAKRRVQTLGTAAVDEARKLVDEARADLDRSGTERTS